MNSTQRKAQAALAQRTSGRFATQRNGSPKFFKSFTAQLNHELSKAPTSIKHWEH